MQTFLPYADFLRSAQCLDNQRLGKQRVECLQILNALKGKSAGWVAHPATKMWRGYTNALAMYMDTCIKIWVNERNFQNNMKLQGDYRIPLVLPTWFGDQEFHDSHKSNLLRKNEFFYGRYGWTVPNNLPYVWPVN